MSQHCPLLDAEPHDLDSVALGDHIAALELLIRRAQAAQARAVRVFEVRDAADALGSPSAKAWLCANLGATDHVARSLVGLGRALDRLPALAAAFSEGATTATHLRIASAASRVLSPETVADGDPALATSARLLDSRDFGMVVDRWVSRVAPAEFERDTEKKYDSRWFSIGATFGGMHSVSGMLDPEAGALLSDAVAGLVAANASDDARTPGQQRADALADLTRAALGSGSGSGSGPASGPGGAAMPRPEIVVHALAETVAGSPGAPPAEVLGVGPVPRSTLDRLACDARWRRLLVDAMNVPVELGRATREISPALRKFVALRDGGCRYPGCSADPRTATRTTPSSGATAARATRRTSSCSAGTTTSWSTSGTTT